MDLDKKILSFIALLVIQVLVSIIYKFSQTKGSYAYSPLSVITSAEFIKLFISCISLFYSIFINVKEADGSISLRIRLALNTFRIKVQQELNCKFIFYTMLLAFLYLINNQLAFILFLNVDIASISMFKSFSTFVSAILLWAFFERQISKDQWAAIILQVIGLFLVQYDSCRNVPLFGIKYYGILLGSTLITGVCSVWNERLIKGFCIDPHIQNGVLYSFGFVFNLSFYLLPHDIFGYSNSKKGFFEGYTFPVLAIIVSNSLLGIMITFVYKYADAIIKTFSTACATGVLLYINLMMFNIKSNITVFLGAIVIFISSYLFLSPKTDISSSSDDSGLSRNLASMKNKLDTIFTCRNLKYCLLGLICVCVSLLLAIYSIRSMSIGLLIGKPSVTIPENGNQESIHMSDVRLSYPVVIFGSKLCENGTSNYTRITLNSRDCFPIEACSDTAISCYPPTNMTNELLTRSLSIQLTKKIERNASITTIKQNISYSKPDTFWIKNNILLIVHFNRPLYMRLQLLQVYRYLFPSVVFTGPERNPDVIECPEGNLGYRAYMCLSRVLQLYPNRTGYFMIHFDLLPIFYNLQQLDISAIWTPVIECFSPKKLDSWAWWYHSVGVQAIRKTFDEMKRNSSYNVLLERYITDNKEANDTTLCRSFSDIYYLPQRYQDEWLLLTRLFSKHEVFLEMAFPTITYMLESRNLSKNVKFLPSGPFFAGGSFFIGDCAEYLRSHPSAYYVHRLDLTQATQQNLIQDIVRKSMPLS